MHSMMLTILFYLMLMSVFGVLRLCNQYALVALAEEYLAQ
jgi:hypothetical protein